MSTLKSSIGSLTIVKANTAPEVFWKGVRLDYLLSVSTFHNPPATSRVTLRVVAPAKVSPPLGASEQLVLTALYDDMIAGGVIIHKV